MEADGGDIVDIGDGWSDLSNWFLENVWERCICDTALGGTPPTYGIPLYE